MPPDADEVLLERTLAQQIAGRRPFISTALGQLFERSATAAEGTRTPESSAGGAVRADLQPYAVEIAVQRPVGVGAGIGDKAGRAYATTLRHSSRRTIRTTRHQRRGGRHRLAR